MFIYGKTAANAIAVMSYLAADPRRRAGSAEIAKSRKISRPLTAKILTQLASAELVDGQPGPGGGYALGKSPDKIRLQDIVSLFEQAGEQDVCPFGSGWCGKGDPCPLHESILNVTASNQSFLEKTTLAVFLGSEPRKGGKPASVKARRVR